MEPQADAVSPAPGVQWRELRSDADLTAAMQEAAQKNEPFVLEIGATWCVGCRIMDKALEKDPEFNGLAGQAIFARLETDKHKLHAPEFTKHMNGYVPKGYPETYVVDPKSQNVITAFEGFPGAHLYTQTLESAFRGEVPAYQRYTEAMNRYEAASGQSEDNAAALAALTDALNIATASFGPTSGLAGDALANLSYFYWQDLGDPLKAESFCLNVKKIQETNPSEFSDTDRLINLDRLQDIYEHDGRYDQAISMLQQKISLEGKEAAPGLQQKIEQLKAKSAQPAYQQFTAAVRQAEIAANNHDYAAEIEARKDVLQRASGSFGPTSRETLDSTIALALAYQNAGDIDSAEQSFIGAQTIINANASNPEFDDCRVFRALEHLYESTGQYAKAIAMLESKKKESSNENRAAAFQEWIDRLKALQH